MEAAMTTDAPATAAPSSTPRLSPLARTARIFTGPAGAWVGLREQSAWGFPLLLGLALWVVLQLVAYDRVTVPTMLDQWAEAVENGRLEAAQEQQLGRFFTESPAARWIVVGQQALAWPILALLQALVLWFGIGFVLGTKLRFGAAMDVVCWSGLVKLPQLLLFFGLAFARQSYVGVHLGLGVLIPEGDAPNKLLSGLRTFLDLIGPFEAWWLFVAVLGAAALSGAPRRSVAWVVVALYLALGAFLAAVGAYFGSGM
jgi:hypothetical protein